MWLFIIKAFKGIESAKFSISKQSAVNSGDCELLELSLKSGVIFTNQNYAATDR